MPATVADCETNQTHWNQAVALAGGGSVWEERGLRWAWQPHNAHLMLSFPPVIDATAAGRGVEFAREHGARIVGAWLSTETDAKPLEAVGFARGWEPWWMAASLDAIREPHDLRVALSTDVPEYGPDGQRLLGLARGKPARAWHAVARVNEQFAGRAWSFVAGEVAGIYDMDVRPEFSSAGTRPGPLARRV